MAVYMAPFIFGYIGVDRITALILIFFQVGFSRLHKLVINYLSQLDECHLFIRSCAFVGSDNQQN